MPSLFYFFVGMLHSHVLSRKDLCARTHTTPVILHKGWLPSAHSLPRIRHSDEHFILSSRLLCGVGPGRVTRTSSLPFQSAQVRVAKWPLDAATGTAAWQVWGEMHLPEGRQPMEAETRLRRDSGVCSTSITNNLHGGTQTMRKTGAQSDRPLLCVPPHPEPHDNVLLGSQQLWGPHHQLRL